jgi:EAL domain-containing protein (putative c-di-GMP-specific phosphodiesterase class I)/GGDEF domain-containing protein
MMLFWQWMCRFLRLQPADFSTPCHHVWQQSALRIIISSGLLLVLTIAIHSSWQAWQQQAYHIIGITFSFYVALVAILWQSRRALHAAAVALLVIVVAGGTCMVLLIDDFALAKLGVIFVYTLPTIALLFFRVQVALALMLLNALPFWFLLRDIPIAPVFGISLTLPGTHAYLHGLIFVFYNLCLPLAMARILATLRRHTRELRHVNKALTQANANHAELFEHQPVPTLLLDAKGVLLKASLSARHLLPVPLPPGTPIHQLLAPIGQPIRPQQHHMHADDTNPLSSQSKQASAAMLPFWQQQDVLCQLHPHLTVTVAAGTALPQQLRLSHVLTTPSGQQWVSMQDVSEVAQLKQVLQQTKQTQDIWQFTDPLTYLPNRTGILRWAAQRTRQSPMPQAWQGGVVRIRHLKAINQQYGFDMGNQLLQQWVKQVQLQWPSHVVMARLYGVRFGFVLPIFTTSASHITGHTELTSPQAQDVASDAVHARYSGADRQFINQLLDTLPRDIELQDPASAQTVVIPLSYDVGTSQQFNGSLPLELLFNQAEYALATTSADQPLQAYRAQQAQQSQLHFQLAQALKQTIQANIRPFDMPLTSSSVQGLRHSPLSTPHHLDAHSCEERISGAENGPAHDQTQQGYTETALPEIADTESILELYLQPKFQAAHHTGQHTGQHRAAHRALQRDSNVEPAQCQPQLVIAGFEALARWRYRDQLISPALFCQLAEQYGFISDLSLHMLQQVVAILQQQRQLERPVVIALNLAGPELLDERFFQSLVQMAKHLSWLSQDLILELTETSVSVRQAALQQRLYQLRQLGFHLDIDDFGTGHASLSQLVDIPAAGIKIDRMFVAGIPQDAQKIRILHATIQMAQSLSLSIVAEGIETEAQQQFFAAWPHILLQGFKLGRPALAAQWLAQL